MDKNLSFISFVIPTYNAERYLNNCLLSIIRQDYPQDQYEILIIDGGSTDRTLSIAEEYETKILSNPFRDAESGKAIGIRKAKGEIIALIDADNELVQKNWLLEMVRPLMENGDIFGVESPWLLRKDDPLLNQYFTLLQIADPLARRFHPEMKIIDRGDYIVYKAKLGQTPVIGANGFLYRKRFISIVGYGKRFEEVNFVAKLIKSGFITYAKPKKVGIYHDYCPTIKNYIKKRIKIGRKFMIRKAKGQETWVDMAKNQSFFGAVLYNISIIGPLIEAIREFRKSKNLAWFWHPIISFLTIAVYFYTTLEFLFLRCSRYET